MTLKLTRALWLWGAALALGLLLLVPLDAAWRVLGAVLVTVAVANGWRRAGLQAERLRAALQLDGGASLPPTSYRQPVVLVCGSGLDALFGESCADGPRLRMTAHGCYIGVADLRQLPVLVAGLQVRRPDWSGQLGVMFVVNPGEHTDSTALAEQARALAHQLALVRKRGVELPLLLTSYLRGSQEPWFVWRKGQALADVHDAGTCAALDTWQLQATTTAAAVERFQTVVQLNGIVDWMREHVLPHLFDAVPVACAMTFVDPLPGERSGNLWKQWLHQRLALLDTRNALIDSSRLLRFPDPILPLLPMRLRATPRARAGVLATWMLAVAALVAFVSSGWSNDRLIRQISADLQRYTSIPQPASADEPSHPLREEAVAALRQHAYLLEHYHRQGEPLALGFGLYRDEVLRAQLLAAVMGHRQPPVPRPLLKLPGTVRLSSLSLFNSGSALLKPESTKVLVNALVDIKAQPGWLIVITGHTDATGTDERNLRLSRARAGAVRDWMQRMGDIPDSCFAVQGAGAGQPIASNDHDDGRMSNRRVDIRLVPAEGACGSTAGVPG